MLAHPNGWRRDTAQRMLVERAGRLPTHQRAAVVAALESMARHAGDWRARLHALWTLDGLDRIEPALVTTALEDRSRDVRAAAIRISERWLAEADHPMQAAVMKRLDDPDWSVQHQLAASAGRASSWSARDGGRRDSSTTAAQLGHAGRGAQRAARRGGRSDGSAARRARRERDASTCGDAHHACRDDRAQLAWMHRSRHLFERIADTSRPAWQRAARASRRGSCRHRRSAAGSAGATRPGPAAGVEPPCPTCQGARGGPGGAYAFPGVIEAQRAGAARVGGPSLRLNRRTCRARRRRGRGRRPRDARHGAPRPHRMARQAGLDERRSSR